LKEEEFMNKENKKGVLVLEETKDKPSRTFSGILEGYPISKDHYLNLKTDKGYGEVVFNTSMTGYQEILTDPSYFGQMVCMTVPHIGNTGVNSQDPESRKAWAAGWIIQDLCERPSNWRSQNSLETFLIENQIPCLTGVDTRALTLHIRNSGAIRGIFLPEEEKHLAQEILKSLPLFEGRDLIAEVTSPEAYEWNPELKQGPRVIALDLGVKWNSLRTLAEKGCRVKVMPAHTSAAEILNERPDGVFLSNGPGDPASAPYATETVKRLLGKVPLFGICMGHQILARAVGAKTYKMKFGHRGGNHPVLDQSTGRVEISSQNHGYAVSAESLPPEAEVTHINLNDQTVEGIDLPNLKAFSVQHHPEACPGPHDSIILFDRFIQLMHL
jgi:carbamoyl-phosphate synthase small subunit